MAFYKDALKHMIQFLCIHLFWMSCHLFASYTYFNWCANYKTWSQIFNSMFYVHHPICIISLQTIQHSIQIIDSMWIYITLWCSVKCFSYVHWNYSISKPKTVLKKNSIK